MSFSSWRVVVIGVLALLWSALAPYSPAWAEEGYSPFAIPTVTTVPVQVRTLLGYLTSAGATSTSWGLGIAVYSPLDPCRR